MKVWRRLCLYKVNVVLNNKKIDFNSNYKKIMLHIIIYLELPV